MKDDADREEEVSQSEMPDEADVKAGAEESGTYPCPFCGKPTSIATIETHPTLPEIELRTFCCDVCGPVRTVAARGRKLPRAAASQSSGPFLEP